MIFQNGVWEVKMGLIRVFTHNRCCQSQELAFSSKDRPTGCLKSLNFPPIYKNLPGAPVNFYIQFFSKTGVF